MAARSKSRVSFLSISSARAIAWAYRSRTVSTSASGRERRLSASCNISVNFARWLIPSESAWEILSTNCMTWRPNSSWTVFV